MSLCARWLVQSHKYGKKNTVRWRTSMTNLKNKPKTRLMVLMIWAPMMLSACAVGPEFHHSEVPTPIRFVRDESSIPAATQVFSVDDAQFWRRFNDAQLGALVEKALSANHDLQAAMARFDRANALLREAKFDHFPAVTFDAEAGHTQVSRDQAKGFPRSNQTYGAEINASWEIDLFGRIRNAIDAQRAESAASAYDVAALQVAIAGETARTYIQLRGSQQRQRIIGEQVENQRQTLALVEARRAAGRGTELDTARARAQLESTRARLPALAAEIAVAEHRLAVLTAQTPDALIAELDTPTALPRIPASIDPGTPAALLRRRPDIAAAEARLQSATSEIGVASADLFPRLSLGGAIGSQAFHSGALFGSGSQTSALTLGIDWSFLDVGRVRARIAASRHNADQQLATYQQTVLLALEDTENALVRFARVSDENVQLAHAAHSNALAARLARERYQAGASGLYETLDAERNVLLAQDTYSDSQTRSAVAAVTLYQALAGGWPEQRQAEDFAPDLRKEASIK
jgi:NodT family efflux transporter outer membrane factor (OMF) lipoprotein